MGSCGAIARTKQMEVSELKGKREQGDRVMYITMMIQKGV